MLSVSCIVPPPSSCFWCFSCFLCFLVLFRSFYVLPWFIKHQKASKSTAAVFFYSFCCELDSSKKHHKAPKSTTSVAAVAEVRYSFHLLFVHFLCLPLPPPAPKFRAFWCFSCFLVLFPFPVFAPPSSPPKFRAFWCFLFFLVLFPFSVLAPPSSPPTLNSVLFGAFRAFRCFFVITMFSLGAQSTKKHAKAR